MLIANAAYDTTFKYFLEDNKLAKLFLELLLNVSILELEIQPQEVVLNTFNANDIEKPISMVRLDFKATIKEDNGSRKIVLIELQKTKSPKDLFRFRNYLGSQYINKENSYVEDEIQIPLPIISIYFLGFSLPLCSNVPIIKVERKYFDISTNENLPGKIPFIETLSHDMILVQLPALKARRRFEIERILSIFDSRAGKYIEVDEKEYPPAYKVFLERLHSVMKKPDVVRDLVYEEMLNNELKRNYEEYLRMKEERKDAIVKLYSDGMSISKLASIFNILEGEIEKLLK